MIEWLTQATVIVTLAGLLIALVGSIAGWVKWAKPRLLERERDRIASRDVLLGRPAVLDSITQDEVLPALPGVGHRIATLESLVTELVADRRRHEAHEEHLKRHDKEIEDLKAAALERALNKVESGLMFQAMDTIARATPDDHAADPRNPFLAADATQGGPDHEA